MTNEEFQAEHPNVRGENGWRTSGTLYPSIEYWLASSVRMLVADADQVLLHHYPSGKVAVYWKDRPKDAELAER